MNHSTISRDEQPSRRPSTRSTALRRLIVEQLAAAPEGRCTVEDLLEAAAARDGDDASDVDVRDGLRLRLYHVDLPVLAAAGIIDYDWYSGDVVFQEDVRPPRDLAADADDHQSGAA